MMPLSIFRDRQCGRQIADVNSDSNTKDNSDDCDSFHGTERTLHHPPISLSDCYSSNGEVDMVKYFQRRHLQILEEDWDSDVEEDLLDPIPNDEARPKKRFRRTILARRDENGG